VIGYRPITASTPHISVFLPDSYMVIGGDCHMIGGVPITPWGLCKRFSGVGSGSIGVIGPFGARRRLSEESL
jgi:hypothetical protein